MSDEIFRPIARRIFLKKSRILIHPIAEPAYRVWYEFYNIKTQLKFSSLNGYYQVTPKLVLAELKDNYLFFDNFECIYHLMMLNDITDIFSLIIPESEEDIERCAWKEVLSLGFQKDINHAEFFSAIKTKAPLSVIQKLMSSKRLDNNQYLNFYGLNKDILTYQQKRIKHNYRKQLPKMSEWIKRSSN